MGIDRVEIHCDERNTASAAVAGGASFELVGTEHRPATPCGAPSHETLFHGGLCRDWVLFPAFSPLF